MNFAISVKPITLPADARQRMNEAKLRFGPGANRIIFGQGDTRRLFTEVSGRHGPMAKNFLQAPNPNRLTRPAHPPDNIPGEGGRMSQKNQNSWNDKWQAQMDKAHAELLEMNELRESLEDLLSQVNLNLRIQIVFMELIHSQIKPPE